MLIDTHCHLASHRFKTNELPQIIANAADAGVNRLITIGTDLEDCDRNRELAETHPEVFATAGIHPTSVPELKEDDWLERIRALLAHEKIIALGEIGMDFYHPAPEPFTEEAYRKKQEDVFRAQLDLAQELDMPVVIHQRESYEAIMAIMEPYHGKVRAVFHCFSNGIQEAEHLLALGHLISFTGIVTYKNAAEVQETARQLPLDRFMVETDAPYLAPVPHRGKRCEPAFTRDTAAHIATLRGISLEDLAAATTPTAEGFFAFPG